MPAPFPNEKTKGAIRPPQGPGEAGRCRPAGEHYPASGTPVGSGLGTRSIPGCIFLSVTAATFQLAIAPSEDCAPLLFSDLGLKESEDEKWSNDPDSLAMESNRRYPLAVFL